MNYYYVCIYRNVNFISLLSHHFSPHVWDIKGILSDIDRFVAVDLVSGHDDVEIGYDVHKIR
jgi:hypothetical protein